MNFLESILNEITPISSTNSIPTKEFIVKVTGDANRRQINKIMDYAKELDMLSKDDMSDDDIIVYTERYAEILADLRKMKISNPKTMSRLIEIALNTSTRGKKKDYSRYTRNLLNLLYRMNKDAFLQNFRKNYTNSKKKLL